MDPISITIAMNGGGEPARLLGPDAVAPYRPAESADYTPGAPQEMDVIGVPENKIEDVDGAVGAYTFKATERPAFLRGKASRLRWRDTTWTVLKVRERYWLGKINGFTLYLGT